jgi:hypothetical protein
MFGGYIGYILCNSGQKISEAKSSIYFSSNTEVEVKTEVCQVLNIMTESLTDKYIGLPALVGANRSREEVKKSSFQYRGFKGPRADGLHAVFFKRFWDMLEDDLVDVVLGVGDDTECNGAN